MKFVTIVLMSLVAWLNAAQAREWQSALGQTFEVYMLQGVENENDEFAILGLYYDTEGESLNDVVDLADSLFEELLAHFAMDNRFSAAVVRFSPPGEVPEGELPPVTADVRYETLDNHRWERVNFTEVAVSRSELFPAEPVTEVVLSSGEALNLEPATLLFPGDRDRKQLNVRAVYPFFAIDQANGARVMELLWNEVVRPMARREGVNNVSVAIYPRPPADRFDFRDAYAEIFSKERWEGWPTYARMSSGTE